MVRTSFSPPMMTTTAKRIKSVANSERWAEGITSRASAHFVHYIVEIGNNSLAHIAHVRFFTGADKVAILLAILKQSHQFIGKGRVVNVLVAKDESKVVPAVVRQEGQDGLGFVSQII